MIWSYGITTVAGRSKLCEQTRESLDAAGFPDPYIGFDFDHTGAYGNWVLTAWKVYLRQPNAHRYVIFQDDLLAYKNLRTYLERIPYPENGYCNLFCWPSNEAHFTNRVGWYPARAIGRGAVALMFSRDALTQLLQQQPFVVHPQDSRRPTSRIDGIIYQSMTNAGFTEYVHNPSLVQHTGANESTVKDKTRPLSLDSTTFRGSTYNALDLLDTSNDVNASEHPVVTAANSLNNQEQEQP
jgi:hypothetical protein